MFTCLFVVWTLILNIPHGVSGFKFSYRTHFCHSYFQEHETACHASFELQNKRHESRHRQMWICSKGLNLCEPPRTALLLLSFSMWQCILVSPPHRAAENVRCCCSASDNHRHTDKCRTEMSVMRRAPTPPWFQCTRKCIEEWAQQPASNIVQLKI